MKSKVVLCTYTGEQIKVSGVIDICVEYGEKKVDASIMIVKGQEANLLGKDLFKNIRLNLNVICRVEKLHLLLKSWTSTLTFLKMNLE